MELVVRCGLAGLATSLVGGFVATQYVDTHVFSIVAPFLVGLLAGWSVRAALAVGRAGAGAVGGTVAVARLATSVAAAAAVAGVAVSFRFVPGGQPLFGSLGESGPPYLAAVVGALSWPLLFGQPAGRRRK